MPATLWPWTAKVNSARSATSESSSLWWTRSKTCAPGLSALLNTAFLRINGAVSDEKKFKDLLDDCPDAVAASKADLQNFSIYHF